MNELPFPNGVSGSPAAQEILRAWVVDGGLNVSLVTAFDNPSIWGILLVDVARHVARSFADAGKYTEAESLAAIYDMFKREWRGPTDVGTTENLRSN